MPTKRTEQQLAALLVIINRMDGELLALRATMGAIISIHPEQTVIERATIRAKEALPGVALGRNIPDTTIQAAAATFDALLSALRA